MTRWFRFYDAVLDDPKVQRLSDAAFRAWVNLMCVASRNHGLISAAFEDISFALRVTAGKARDLIQILQSAGLIDPVEEGWEPHNWKNRQYESDSPAERMRRHRANKKSNALQPPLRNSDGVEQIQNRTETETERKKKVAPLGRFDEFWLVCPKKTGRGAAEKAWIKAISLAEAQTLIDAMRAYAGSQASKDKTFTKTPGPWLNGKHWLDEGIAPAENPMSPEEIADVKDRADKLQRRGKYAESYQ